MYLSQSKPIEGKIVYIVKSYRANDGRTTSKNVRRLGTLSEIREREGVEDAWAWAQSQLELENASERENRRKVSVGFHAGCLIGKGSQRSFNVGYLILDKIYHDLSIKLICDGISRKSRFRFDLNEVMRQLVFGRVLWPASKLVTWRQTQSMALVRPVELQHIYRALVAMSSNMEYIQARLFHYSKDVLCRNTTVIYYDCTNFFFESTRQSELRRPGASKENRRTPIVQMGVFMDADGLPLAFNINPGNTNEQTTLRPLERMVGEKMDIEEFIICTDAGLSSSNNRLYNDTDNRKFITAQSVRTLPNTAGKKKPGLIKDWALADDGWFLPADPTAQYTLEQINAPRNRDRFFHLTFYKQRWFTTWVKEKDTGAETRLEQRCIVSFSLKYKEYQRMNRENNISKAENAIRHGNAAQPAKSFRNYITQEKCTAGGEVAEIDAGYSINYKLAEEEAIYDGFYAICTNLEEKTDKSGGKHHTISDITKINHARWEIEETFRIMKTQLKARPVYHQTDEAIKGHFIVCFIAVFIYRVLEHRLNDAFSTDRILAALRTMNVIHIPSEGFVPAFKRTDITDQLFNISGFRLDTEIILLKKLKSIISTLKHPK